MRIGRVQKMVVRAPTAIPVMLGLAQVMCFILRRRRPARIEKKHQKDQQDLTRDRPPPRCGLVDFRIFDGLEVKQTGPALVDALCDYIRAEGTISPSAEPRLKDLSASSE